MRLVISNIPDSAEVDYIVDGIYRLMSDDVHVQQIPEGI